MTINTTAPAHGDDPELDELRCGHVELQANMARINELMGTIQKALAGLHEIAAANMARQSARRGAWRG